MKNFSSIERVVGNIAETEKKKIIQHSEEQFNNQSFEDLEKKEREKTPEELQMISLANKVTNEIRQRYGLENFDIPPENFHIFIKEAWPEDAKGVAVYNSMLQGVGMQEQPAKIAFMEKVFHEMLHFKSYNASQVIIGEGSGLDEYRVGFSIYSRDMEKKYFTNLNEAVTEEMTKKFGAELFKLPLFAEEIKHTEEFIKRFPQAITDSGEPLFDEDTLYAEIEMKKLSEGESNPSAKKDKQARIITSGFVYQSERKILHILINKLFEKNKDKFKNKDEIFEVFAKGMMTGNILPVGRLIDKTFGRGTLRQIGELDEDIIEQENFVNSL